MDRSCAFSGSRCIVRQSSLWPCCKRDGRQGRHVCACVWVSRWFCLPWAPPVTRLSIHPCMDQGSRCTPTFHVEHSPCGRWIVGAASLSGRTPKRSSQVRLAIKNDIGWSCHPGLYVAVLTGAAYRCRLNKYQRVPRTHPPLQRPFPPAER